MMNEVACLHKELERTERRPTTGLGWLWMSFGGIIMSFRLVQFAAGGGEKCSQSAQTFKRAREEFWPRRGIVCT